MNKRSHTIFQWMLLCFVFLIGQTNYAADFYWRQVAADSNLNNMGNWELDSSGSNTPAIAAPGPGDNVFFTVASNKQALTSEGGEFNCNNMTFTPGLTYTFSGSGKIINIYGSLTGNESISISQVTLQFCSSGSSTIDMGVSTNKIKSANIIFKGSGTYSLEGNDFITSSSINFASGSFISNGKTIAASNITIPAAAVARSLDFSNSEMQVTQLTPTLMANNEIISETTNLVFTSYNKIQFRHGGSIGHELQFKSITFAETSADAIIGFLDTKTHGYTLIVEDLYLKNKSLEVIIYSSLVDFTLRVTGTLHMPIEYDISSNAAEVKFEINNINSPISPCGSLKTFTNRSPGKFEVKALNNKIETTDISFKGITFSGEGFKAPVSNDLGLNTGLIEWTSAIPAITYYWVGGNGEWNDPSHWATSSGGTPSGAGCLPTGTDDVVFDDASFTTLGETVSINASVVLCRNITWTDTSKEGKLVGSKKLGVLGNANYSGCGGVDVSIDYLGEGTIASGGVTYTSPTINFVQEKTYSLVDDLKTSAAKTTIYINSGTFKSNGNEIVANEIISKSSPTTAIRTIDMQNSDITVTSKWALASDSSITDFTNTHIQLTAPGAVFETRGINKKRPTVQYDKISFTATTGIGYVDIYGNGSSTPNYVSINSLHFNSNANIYYSLTIKDLYLTKGKEYLVRTDYSLYFTGNIYTTGSDCDLAIFKSSGSGKMAKISKSTGPFNAEGLYVKDINSIGVPLVINGGVDGGNNLNVTVAEVTGRDMYWVGGSGNWSDGGHWSIGESGGNPAINNVSGCIPRSIDNVFFDNKSFLATSDVVTLDIDGQCNNMTWTTAAGTQTPTFVGNKNKLTIDGSVELALGTQFNDSFELIMNGEKTGSITQSLNTNKTPLSAATIYFKGTNRFELLNDLKASGVKVGDLYNLNNSFFTNGYNIDAVYMEVYTAGTVDISNSTITCTKSESFIWNFNKNKAGSLFKSDGSVLLSGGSIMFHIKDADDTAFFNIIKFTNNNINTIYTNAGYNGLADIKKLEFSGNSRITNTNIEVDTLIYAQSTTNAIPAGKTLVVRDSLIAYGTKCNPLTLQSNNASTQATLKSSKCNINIPFGLIKNVIADHSNGCDAEGYHILAAEAGALQNSPGWSVDVLGSLSLLGEDIVLDCADYPYTQTTKEKLGIGIKYEWYYNDVLLSNTTDEIQIEKPGTYSLTITYAPGCFIDKTVIKRTFGVDVPPPTVTCPGDKEVMINSDGCKYIVNDDSFDATIINSNCNLMPSVDNNVWYTLEGATQADVTLATTLKGVTFNEGVTTVTWYVENYAKPGEKKSCSFTVTVKSASVLIVSNDIEICEGETTILTASGAKTYEWNPADGLSVTNGETVMASPSTTTTYTVVGTDEFGCTQSQNVTVTVNPLPDTGNITGSTGTITVDQTLQLSSNGATDGTWSSSDEAIASITTNGLVKGLTVGTTDIIYTITNAKGCSNTVKTTLTVKAKQIPTPNPNPNPTPDPTPNPIPDFEKPAKDPKPKPGKPGTGLHLKSTQVICAGEQTVTIPFESAYAAEDIECVIRFSDGAHAVGIKDQTIPLSPTGFLSFSIPANTPSGIYKGTFVIEEYKSINLITDYPFEFEILEGVKITKQPQLVNSSCDNDEFGLTVEATGGDLAYQWYLNDKLIPGANKETYQAIFSAQTEGVYHVEIIGLCGVAHSDKISVGGALRILIKWDDVLYIMNTDNRYVSYQWYKDGVEINPYGKAVYYTDEKNGLNGTYKVRAYKTDDTYDESCSMHFATTTKSASASVSPNPVQRNASISVHISEVGESISQGNIEIYDMVGRKVYTGRTTGVNTQISMNVPTGSYIVQIKLESGKVITQKLIVK